MEAVVRETWCLLAEQEVRPIGTYCDRLTFGRVVPAGAGYLVFDEFDAVVT